MQLTGARVFLKAETLQRTGSFKFRGAYNKISPNPERAPRRRRGRLFVRQSCAGRGGRGQLLRHAGGDRDAVGCAAAQARAHRRARRRGRALRPRPRRPRRHRPRDRGEARRDAGAAVRRSDGHRRAGHRRPRDRGGPGGARHQAGRGGDRRLGRRARGRHHAGAQGARAGPRNSTPPSRKASTTPRARSSPASARRTRA